MARTRNLILAGVAVAAAAGLGTGISVTAGGSQAGPASTPPGPATPAVYSAPGYSWYRSMMGGYDGKGDGMMTGWPSSRWMTSRAGYQWMTGGSGAPGWMTGGALPSAMRGTRPGTSPGTVMGSLFANAPGPRVTPADARRLGGQDPAGAIVNRTARTITFTGATVNLVVLASPPTSAGAFLVAGMTDPAISVPARARVSIELVNADAHMAHGLVIMPAGAARAPMPMMTGAPAFPGAALWFLGKPATGMHAGTITFTPAPGSYQYLCPVPGHGRNGMAGVFIVR